MESRILVIDDTPTHIETIAATLREEGYKVSVATSGEQGLDLLQRFRPDLILLDVMMPGLDGFETCARLKESTEWREIPVIFLTAKGDPEDIVHGFEAGAVDYVSKPFNAHELLARVRTHLTLDHLYRENQRLLLNVLPATIAEKLKKQTGIIAERYDDVSVLFADLVGFTPLSTTLRPVELLELLNRVFSGFDVLASERGLEKIKTIGDAYMVAGGLPEPQPDHLALMAELALKMQESMAPFNTQYDGLSLRVGLHAGSAIAGVIGIRKFIYDVWGDTVNTASRLESHGLPGRIHVGEVVYERLRTRFDFEPRGVVDLKGKGPMKTYLLNAARPES